MSCIGGQVAPAKQRNRAAHQGDDRDSGAPLMSRTKSLRCSTQEVIKQTMTKKNEKPHSRNIAAELGRRGGLAIAKKRGKKYMESIGKKGAAARWKIKK